MVKIKNLNIAKILTKLRIFIHSYLEFISFESSFKHYKLTYFIISLLCVVVFSSSTLEELYRIENIEGLRFFKDFIIVVCCGIFATKYWNYTTKGKKNNYLRIILWYLLILLIFPCFSCIFLLATNLQHYAVEHSMITTLLLSSLLQPALFLSFNIFGYLLGYYIS